MNYPVDDYIVRFLAREETPEDVQSLKEWLAIDPAHRDELKQWLVAWDTAAMTNAAEKFDSDKAFQRFMFRVNAEPKPETTPEGMGKVVAFKTILRIAAIFVISFSLGIAFYYWTKNQPEQVAFIENVVPLGSKSEIKMPDGNMVWLNAGSTLRYPTDYGKTRRDIYLSGEGYFNVTQQAGKPLTVHTPLANITVVGTEFNVMAYPDENVMETTLIKGEVVVENGEVVGAFDRTVLKPGQKLSVTLSDSLPVLVVTQLDLDIADAEVSWKEHNWRIESMPLQDLSVKLERRYDVHIRIDDRLKDKRFSGTLNDESLEQTLHTIQLAAPILFSIDGKNVDISVDPQEMK